MRRMILFLAITTALLVRVAGADQPTKPESTATGILKITVDRDSALANERFLIPLVTTKSLLKEAIPEVSKEAALELYKVASVETIFDGRIPAQSIVVKSFDERVPADKLLEALVEVLNRRLRDIAQKEYDAAARRMDKENARVEKLAAILRTRQEALMNMAAIHKVEIDPALAAQKRLRIETELQSLDVQLQGLKARREIIEHQIARLAETVAKDPGDAAIVKALQTRIDVQRAALNRMRESNRALTGTITRLALVEAEAKLLEAEAELPKYRREAAQLAGGRRIAQLKTRLDDAAIEMAEIDAKRRVLLERFEKARKYSGDVGMKRIELELLEREYRHRAEEFGKRRAELQKIAPPVVTLIPLD